MKKRFFISTLIFLLFISSNTNAMNLGDLRDPRVEITEFIVPDLIKVGESFSINVTIENHRLFQIRTTIQVNLLDGMLNNILKDIGTDEKQTETIKSKDSITIDIQCKIREGDTDWFKERYNLEVVVFKNYLFLGGRIQLDNAIQGIHIITDQTILNEKLIEKEKVRITEVIVKEKLPIGDDNDEFNAYVHVVNDGCYDFDTWVRIDLIEKPSAIPELEEYIDIKSLGSNRKEIGKSVTNNIKLGCEQPINFTIPCDLRETELRKETFNIEAVLFVTIDGMEYKVDSSTIYGVYHDQPFCRGEFCTILIIIAIFIILIAIGIIAVIIRIIYPMYYRKKNELRREMVRAKLEKHEDKIKQIKEKEGINTKKIKK